MRTIEHAARERRERQLELELRELLRQREHEQRHAELRADAPPCVRLFASSMPHTLFCPKGASNLTRANCCRAQRRVLLLIGLLLTCLLLASSQLLAATSAPAQSTAAVASRTKQPVVCHLLLREGACRCDVDDPRAAIALAQLQLQAKDKEERKKELADVVDTVKDAMGKTSRLTKKDGKDGTGVRPSRKRL